MKKVVYNGGTKSYYICTNHIVLVKGAEYKVKKIIDRGRQIDYELEGIKGQFFSEWFDDVKEN